MPSNLNTMTTPLTGVSTAAGLPDGMTMDNTVIGSITAKIGTFTTLNATTLNAVTSNVTTIVDTSISVGVSGTAGTLDIFPTTAAKGKLEFLAGDSAGNTTTTITNASQAGARTYTIPDAGASAAFVMTAGAQTLTSKTLTAPVLGGSVTGTYTLAGTPTITAPAITGATLTLAAGQTGTVTLNGVTPVTVAKASVTANSNIIFTLKTPSGTVGAYPAIQTITAGVGFDVAGTALDASVYNFAIIG